MTQSSHAQKIIAAAVFIAATMAATYSRALSGDAPVRVVIVVDRSYSMCQNPSAGGCCVEGDGSNNCMMNDPDDLCARAFRKARNRPGVPPCGSGGNVFQPPREEGGEGESGISLPQQVACRYSLQENRQQWQQAIDLRGKIGPSSLPRHPCRSSQATPLMYIFITWQRSREYRKCRIIFS